MTRRRGIALLCALPLLTSLACGEGSGMIGVMTRDTTGRSSGELLATVQVSNNAFSPVLVNLRRDGVVTWVWTLGATDHNVTFSDPLLSSSTLSSGTHSVTFSTAGTFNYACTVHPGMAGSIVVR